MYHVRSTAAHQVSVAEVWSGGKGGVKHTHLVTTFTSGGGWQAGVTLQQDYA